MNLKITSRKIGWTIALLGSVFSIFFFGSSTQATMTTFYAGDCSGGWTGVSNATGTPSLASSAHEYDFNEFNSAVAGDIVSDITCGNFAGEIPRDSLPKKISLQLFWTHRVPVETKDIVSTSTASSITTEVLDGVSTSISNTPVQNVESTTSVESTSVVSPTNEVVPIDTTAQLPETKTEVEIFSPIPTPEPVVETPAPESTIQSFLHNFITPVFAEEISTSSDSISTSSLSLEIGTTTAPSLLSEDFVKIEFSIDGESWTKLGLVNAETFSHTFELPFEEFKDWNNLSKLQVRISRLSTFNTQPYLYLDAVAIHVDYSSYTDTKVKIVEMTNSLPTFTATSSVSSSGLVTVSSEPTGIAVYKGVATSSTLLFTTALDQNPIDIDITHFAPFDTYILVSTHNANWCSDKTLTECISDPEFIATSSFKIIPE
jgi:hypothetical protein